MPGSLQTTLSPVDSILPNHYPGGEFFSIYPSGRILVFEKLDVPEASPLGYLWEMNENLQGARRERSISELARAARFLGSRSTSFRGLGRRPAVRAGCNS